jgi:Transposase IS116/IS110/IS902 family
LPVIAGRDGGDFARTRRLGAARFEQAVRREITRRGGQKPCLRIVRGLFTALTDPAGVIAHRAGALERVQLLLEDGQLTKSRLAQTELRMTAVLDELGLTALVTSMTGLSAIGAAAILAETGDPRRFATARAVVKHAGLAPREKLSGAFTGRTRLTGQGRPGLRLAAWRAVWGAQRANPVYRARYQHLTSRDQNKLTPTQAQTIIAARSCGSCTRSSPPGRHGIQPPRPTAPGGKAGNSPPDPVSGASSWRPGRALRGIETHRDLGAHHGQPRPSSLNPITRCWDKPHTAMQGQTTDEAPAQSLTQTDSR